MATPEADQEDEGLILRGSIDETSVPELLWSVLGSGETGVLTFRRGDVTKSVYLHMGRVTYARSSNPDERLGEDLLLRGRVSIRQYIEASKLVAPGRRLGTILVELGALESEDLIGAVEHHVKEILLDVFSWGTGEYELVMTEPGADDVVALNLSTEDLILAGIRRIRSWTRRVIWRPLRAVASQARYQVFLRARRTLFPWLRSASLAFCSLVRFSASRRAADAATVSRRTAWSPGRSLPNALRSTARNPNTYMSGTSVKYATFACH